MRELTGTPESGPRLPYVSRSRPCAVKAESVKNKKSALIRIRDSAERWYGTEDNEASKLSNEHISMCVRDTHVTVCVL